MAGYRDDREAAHARADALEAENRTLRAQLESQQRVVAGQRRRRIALGGGAVTLVLLASAAQWLGHVDLAPPDIDSPPGVYGTLHLQIVPFDASVRVDDGSWRDIVGDHVDLTRLDPNVPHRVTVRANGYLDASSYFTVPAHGIRRASISLQHAPNP